MRVLPVACVAVVAIVNTADAFTSSASYCAAYYPRTVAVAVTVAVAKPSVAGKSIQSNSDLNIRYHHLGDLDHDDLPEDNFFPNPTKEEKDETPEVVLYDNVAVALDDEAYGLAMQSIMALFLAVAVAFGGAGVLKPRPVLAVEPMTFSTRENVPTMVFRSGEL